jgi:carbonic anhydrase
MALGRFTLLLLSLAATAIAGESPIDFVSSQTFFSALPPLVFNYSGSTHLNVIDTGSPDHEATVRANVDSGSSLTIDGIVYNLLQFHFHAEAEHLVNGFLYPMEMHLVHQQDGASGSDGLLVVGRFIDIAPVGSAALSPIFDDLTAIHDTGLDLFNYDLNALIPGDLGTWRYTGSLTAAPFTAPVLWNVLQAPMSITQAQLDAFAGLFPHGNTREAQPLDGRTVLTDIEGFAVPEPASAGLMAVGALALLATVQFGRGAPSRSSRHRDHCRRRT